jgi:aminoglycoside phosphotransferase family enzyme
MGAAGAAGFDIAPDRQRHSGIELGCWAELHAGPVLFLGLYRIGRAACSGRRERVGCPMTRKANPEFHNALMDQASYPVAPRHIRYQETRCSHLYKTGAEVFKVPKASHVYSSLAVTERLVREALASGRRWAPQVMLGMAQIVEAGGGFRLAALPGLPDAAGALPLAPAPPDAQPVAYALRERQMPESPWVDQLVRAGKLTDVSVGRIARFLAQRHAEAPAEERAAAGRPEQIAALADELLTQVRKHIGGTLSEPMYQLMARPLQRALPELHKLFVRRVKKGRIVRCHGAFVPEHVYVKSLEVQAVSPVLTQTKYHFADAVTDAACFVNGLLLLDGAAAAELFSARYAAASKDRDLDALLPCYQVLMALRRGLSASEAAADPALPDDLREEFRHAAQSHFSLGVHVARSMGRPAPAPSPEQAVRATAL